MKVNLQKIVPNFSCNKDTPNYIKQINVYETIEYNINSYKSLYSYNTSVCGTNCGYSNSIIYNIEHTCPMLNIISTNIIDTIEGSSLECQYLTGKKLIIIGEIDLSLIITYNKVYNLCDTFLRKVKIPFSTFIIIPKSICDIETINLKYLVEDVSIVELCLDKILVSITLLFQYIDKY